MNDQQDVASKASTSAPRNDRGAEYALVPPADVREHNGGISLQLDVPGVSKDRLSIEVDKNTLAIAADMQFVMPQGLQPLYAEIHSTRYRRSFTLSGELDAEKIVANLSNGVLSVTIPLRAELRPRKVEVRVN
jgi:HSP20 family molecular chaperone IbpA